ncbi:transposase/terminase small subunit (endogenous virus) [Clostridium phage phiCT453A]|uniref:terminase small subunit n=1 Tax=Clostridium phage phiCT453A TaxID=1567012 RepID=UPI000512E1AE|nr:transposase [Clostridium tetani]YP_009216668.1 terminase small subunit [Clostridium phage phiCT453A]AJA42514.1 transposase/terminase small subunit [Clostridium phage phiCT453A]KGI42496.1 transposase [Clostridium tetani]RXM58093.1 transposase [Clostridium tetani]
MAKSKYETNVKDKLILVEGWARNGLTDEQIAKNLGIGYSTLKEYKKKYPAFLAALKKGKEVIDFEVENALLKRALGYEYEEVTKERILKKDEQGKPLTDIHGFPIYEMVVTKTVKKEVTPDTTAQIFWLKNRKPEDWRDKQNIEHSGNLSNEVNITIDGENYGD